MNTNNATQPTKANSVQAVLTSGQKKRGKGRWLLTLAILAAIGAGAAYYWLDKPQARTAVSYKTVEAKTGDISVSVTATGNLKPKNQVDIGTELSGTVDKVLVDANDQVKKGQKLASLKTNQLEDTVTRSKATLASAVAKVTQAAAGIVQAQAALKQAQANYDRLQTLYATSGGKLPAKGDIDTAQATLDKAKADIDNNKAIEAAAKAAVAEAQANLRSDQANLGKAMITSPINGVVLTRSIEPGQTVAASLSAPTLFTLAEDLAQMEVDVAVDEADVGKVKAGQKAEFTVDAWPGRKYPAEISRVSLGSTTTDNVVTYITVLNVKNDDLTLRPGMTATATIQTDSRSNVLVVPNAALQFSPRNNDSNGAGNGQRPSGNSSFISQLMPRPPRMETPKRRTTNSTEAASTEHQRVWIVENNAPKRVAVKTGITDGKITEIVGGDLQAGMQVIVDTNTPGSGPQGAGS